jgi:hypothetical protein
MKNKKALARIEAEENRMLDTPILNEADKAKQLLKSKGYFVDNLWTVNDVLSKFKCSEEQAQDILYSALTNEATIEQIWFSIQEFGDMEDLEEND